MKQEIERLEEENERLEGLLTEMDTDLRDVENESDDLRDDITDLEGEVAALREKEFDAQTYKLPIENQNDELKIQVLKEHWDKITLADVDKMVSGL